MSKAFPHDELKPIHGTYTDSLPELGNAKKANDDYHGLSLTLVDSIDSLLLFNRTDSFIFAFEYLKSSLKNIEEKKDLISEENVENEINLDSNFHSKTASNNNNHKNEINSKFCDLNHTFTGFDINIRVHVFETTIRMLGGLLSAHAMIVHPKFKKYLINTDYQMAQFVENYDDEFLALATDLGEFSHMTDFLSLMLLSCFCFPFPFLFSFFFFFFFFVCHVMCARIIEMRGSDSVLCCLFVRFMRPV